MFFTSIQEIKLYKDSDCSSALNLRKCQGMIIYLINELYEIGIKT